MWTKKGKKKNENQKNIYLNEPIHNAIISNQMLQNRWKFIHKRIEYINGLNEDSKNGIKTKKKKYAKSNRLNNLNEGKIKVERETKKKKIRVSTNVQQQQKDKDEYKYLSGTTCFVY